MWRYEVAWFNEEGIYTWKGFGHADKFERFLRKLKRKGLEILSISDWDGEGVGARLKKQYLG